MPWSTFNRIVQNVVQYLFIFSSPPLEKILIIIIEKIEGLSLVDTSFAPRDSARVVNLFWPCHPPPLVTGVTMIQIFTLRQYIASGIRGGG